MNKLGKTSALFGVLIAASMLMTPALTFAADAPAAKPRQAEIPFSQMRGTFRDWQADGDRAFYVQTIDRQWYHGELFGPCFGLPFATRLGVITEASGSFSRFSAIRVDGERCKLNSLVKSDPPPPKKKHEKADANG